MGGGVLAVALECVSHCGRKSCSHATCGAAQREERLAQAVLSQAVAVVVVGGGGKRGSHCVHTIQYYVCLTGVVLCAIGNKWKKLHSGHNAGFVVSRALLNCHNYHLKMSITAT